MPFIYYIFFPIFNIFYYSIDRLVLWCIKEKNSISFGRCCLCIYRYRYIIYTYVNINIYMYIYLVDALYHTFSKHSMCISLIFITIFYDKNNYCSHFTNEDIETQRCYSPRTSKWGARIWTRSIWLQCQVMKNNVIYI